MTEEEKKEIIAESQVPEPKPEPQKEVMPQGPVIHTFQDDLSQAMNATDASVVQEMLATARRQEEEAKEQVRTQKERSWYVVGSLLLFIIALTACAYGIYHYRKLTVPVSQSIPIGVFSTLPPAYATQDIDSVISTAKANTSLQQNKPYIIPVIVSETNSLPVSRTEFFRFIKGDATEPLIASIDSIRLGVVNTGDSIEPFIITSTPDPERSSKEFAIAEKELAQIFSHALATPSTVLAAVPTDTVKPFDANYIYNLPVRTQTVTTPEGDATAILYGYATNNIIVLTRDPEALKAVYDTIIRQL
jgi:hypothetical protein